MSINVKDSQFGAVGDGSKDDSAAIQKAIDFAKTRSVNQFAPYLATVYFPAGYYLVNNSINLTNANGIWITGDGGSYLNTIILGNTGNAVVFDFSGSSQSGCENLTFLPVGGTGNNPSTLAVQFALTNNGGLNCGIKRCYFQMTDVPSANSGLGSIGILNVRSEEFYVHECLIRGNSPLILTYNANVVIPGANYQAKSSFQALSAGTGSMGVVSVKATSLQSIEKRQPALILVGTNSVNFQGYLGRIITGLGANETAVLCTTSTSNLKLHATVESFSRAVSVVGSGFENCDLDIVVANAVSPTTEIIDVTNCVVIGSKIRVSQPVESERNRLIIYHANAQDGNAQAAGIISNSEIVCYSVPSNQLIISANLLKRATNVVFSTPQPFEKRSGKIKQLNNVRVSAGTTGSLTSATIFQFKEARKKDTSNNSGYYRIWIDGVVKGGGYGSGKAALYSFQSQIVVNQRYDGVLDVPSITVVTLDQSSTDPTYLNITGVNIDFSITNGIASVVLIPRVSGGSSGEAVYFEGCSAIKSDFFVNEPIPLN